MTKDEIFKVLNSVLNVKGISYNEDEGMYGKYYNTLPDALMEELYGGEEIEADDYIVKQEENFGGEGEGDNFWQVYSLTNTNDGNKKYIRFDGWYASHYGHEFNGDNFDIVVPKEVVKIEYYKA